MKRLAYVKKAKKGGAFQKGYKKQRETKRSERERDETKEIKSSETKKVPKETK
jgi:hypothetical protein